jgi:hypothetical protein
MAFEELHKSRSLCGRIRVYWTCSLKRTERMQEMKLEDGSLNTKGAPNA